VVGPVATTSFMDRAVEAGTTYNYELRARDTAGNVSTPTKLSVQGQCFLIWCWLL
jgi:chitodextrinase